MGSRPNTPTLLYSSTPFRSRASPLDLFEQPAKAKKFACVAGIATHSHGAGEKTGRVLNGWNDWNFWNHLERKCSDLCRGTIKKDGIGNMPERRARAARRISSPRFFQRKRGPYRRVERSISRAAWGETRCSSRHEVLKLLLWIFQLSRWQKRAAGRWRGLWRYLGNRRI